MTLDAAASRRAPALHGDSWVASSLLFSSAHASAPATAKALTRRVPAAKAAASPAARALRVAPLEPLRRAVAKPPLQAARAAQPWAAAEWEPVRQEPAEQAVA